MFMEYWNELYFYDFPEIVSSWKVAGQRLIFAGVSHPSHPLVEHAGFMWNIMWCVELYAARV